MTDAELEAAADRDAVAAIFEARGRDRQARAVLLEVLATRERVLGAEHYDVVGSSTGWRRSRSAVSPLLRSSPRGDAIASRGPSRSRCWRPLKQVLGTEHYDVVRLLDRLVSTALEANVGQASSIAVGKLRFSTGSRLPRRIPNAVVSADDHSAAGVPVGPYRV